MRATSLKARGYHLRPKDACCGGPRRALPDQLRGAAHLHAKDQPDLTTILDRGLRQLPAFAPDDGEPPPSVLDRRRLLGSADAALLSTLESAGTLPGCLRNLLDWTIPSGDLDAKPVA